MMASNKKLSLPIVEMKKLISDALPGGTIVTPEAITAIRRASSIFILFQASAAFTNAEKEGRKTINATDVFAAIEEMDLEQEFMDQLQQALRYYEECIKPLETEKQQEESSTPRPSSSSSSSSSKQSKVTKNTPAKASNQPESVKEADDVVIVLSDSNE